MYGYRFQEKFTGCQMIIWHKNNERTAREEFSTIVTSPNNWILLGIVYADLFNKSTKEI